MFVVNLIHPVSGLTNQIFLNGLERAENYLGNLAIY